MVSTTIPEIARGTVIIQRKVEDLGFKINLTMTSNSTVYYLSLEGGLSSVFHILSFAKYFL
jgi:hypothetical protein